MSIDWSKAPEGAEFYSSRPRSGLSFYRSIKPDAFEFWNEHQPHWRAVNGTPRDYTPVPCQTQERARQKAISEMLLVPHCPLSEQAAAELYDAGYRKFEIVEDGEK